MGRIDIQHIGIINYLTIIIVIVSSGGCGQRLVSTRSPSAILAEVRPEGGMAMCWRGCAHWRLGELRRARQELLLAAVADPQSVQAHRLLAELELRLGNRGSALSHLEAAHRLSRGKDREVARALADALLQRARDRLDRRIGLFQTIGAKTDLRRAAKLDPSSGRKRCVLVRQLIKIKKEFHNQVGRVALLSVAGDPFRDTVHCPGPPRGVGQMASPLPARRCTLPRPGRFLDNLLVRHMLVGCYGAQLARRLERHGCVLAARRVWQRMAEEAPTDPRWPLMIARSFLATNEPNRAAQRLQSHVFYALDRAAALLNGAELMLAAGHNKRAAKMAVLSTSFAAGSQTWVRAVSVLRRADMANVARQLIKIKEKNRLR